MTPPVETVATSAPSAWPFADGQSGLGGRWLRYAVLLVAFNAVAHFIPFERASLAPDDYFSLLRSTSVHGLNLAEATHIYPDRPIFSVVTVAQAKLFGAATAGPLVLLFLSTSAVLVAVFSLLRLLLGDPRPALVAAVVFGLLPNKLETYHASVQNLVNLGFLYYLVSFLLFVQSTRTRAATPLVASFLAYALGVFSYEVGFFLPGVLLVYCWLYARRSVPTVALFALPAIAYAGYRFWAIEMMHAVAMGRLRPLVTLLHQYAGGYLALALANGATCFFDLPWPWLTLAILCDAAVLWTISRLMARPVIPAIGPKEWWLALSMFALFLLPLFLQSRGGVAGRHLTLPSVGVAIAILGGLRWLGPRARPVLLALVAAGLLVSQGTAWAQVVACRINQAVYETMKDMRGPLEKAHDVVIDVNSFRDAIPSSWVRFDYAFLNSYYGAQTFEGWGLESMVRLVSADPNKPVHLAVGEPRLTEDGLLTFTEGRETGSRSFRSFPQALQADGTVVIDYNTVYGRGFHQGQRRSER